MTSQQNSAVIAQIEVKPSAEIDNISLSAPQTLRDKKSTSFNSIAELKKEAPELYKKLLEGIGLEICREMREHQARMKKILRENSTH